MKVEDLDRTKLKARTKPSPSHEKQENDEPVKVIPTVQLKKVDREKQKKEEEPKDSGIATQVKLRPTEMKAKEEEPKDSGIAQQIKLRPTETKAKAPDGKTDSEKEVPWMASLEKKRKAVMESENKAKKSQDSSLATSIVTLPPPVLQKPKRSVSDASAKDNKEDLGKKSINLKCQSKIIRVTMSKINILIC